MNEKANMKRRHFLTASTSVIGGFGVAAACYPFLSAWKPSVRAEASGAPVEVNISKLQPGQLMTVEWRGKPVWILHRSQKELDTLSQVTNLLSDPLSEKSQQPTFAHNPQRSLKPEYLVLVGICTHFGCSPLYRPNAGADNLGEDWKGGFFCPCHGSTFDISGRVYKNVPAPDNLPVPPYHYIDDNNILIGVLA